MAAECKAGHGCKAAGIRDALMVALRYDKNESVREKALQAWSRMWPRICGCGMRFWRR